MIDFTDRVVLVTGAAGGIGAAITETIVRHGGSVVMHDLHAGGRLAAIAHQFGDAVYPVAADLTDPTAAQRVWHDATRWRGRVDVLVNNAGIYEPARVDDDADAWLASWQRTIAICLVSPAALCREAVKSFRDQPTGGIIVNLASRAAWRGEDADYWHYAAAKAGVVAMTKTIARQYGRQGVTAFAVAPGFVDTPFNAPAVAAHGIDLFISDTALGEVAQPQDIANVVVFLASGAARHATGTTIDVNSASYVR